MKKIVVIGSLNVDFSLSIDKLPKPGQTIVANNLTISNGGKGANQAYTIGKLGGNVNMIGMVGNDIYGKNLKNSLKKVGVGIKKIISINKETGKAFIQVDHTGENVITIIPGANDLLSKEIIEKNKKTIKAADIILLQLEIPLDTVEYILDVAKDKIIILDPAPADKQIMVFDLSNVYLIKPNETELEILTGIKITDKSTIIEGAKKLLSRGIKNVVVSLAGEGCVLVNDKGVTFFDAIKTDVVDTTAAGDSFIASIALAIASNRTLTESINFATKVASKVVSKKGAQNSIPDRKEIL